MSAWICGVIGVLSSFVIGTRVLGLSPVAIVPCVLGSIGAGLAAVLLTLKGERTPWLRKHVMTRPLKTWAVLVVFYFGPLLLVAPPLRRLGPFLWLVIPLILSTGFSILIFGPIQDRIITNLRRKAELI